MNKTTNKIDTEWIRFAYQRGFTVVYPDGYVQPGWPQAKNK